MDKASLGAIRPCGQRDCPIATNKRYKQEGVGVVACSPHHAEKALKARGGE